MTTDWATAIRHTSERARAANALAPFASRAETLTENGLTYVVRVLDSLRVKQVMADSGAPAKDPFAPPYESDLVVGELEPAHMVLLNKFPVLDHHGLAITRAAQPQTDLLTVADCEALLRLLHNWDALVFYNAGPVAGASQPHRHLQVIDRAALPPQSILQALSHGAADDTVGRSSRLPFPHARVPMPQSAWQQPAVGAATVHARYLDMLTAVGLPPVGPEQPGPYNFLATRQWLWLVPRSQPRCDGIYVNALSFAGTLLVFDDEQLANLKAMGPAACLRAVSS